MNSPNYYLRPTKWLRLSLPILGGLIAFVAILLTAQFGNQGVHADAIEPPEGYPKFNTSVQVVSPTLTTAGGETLFYEIEIRNTGAYTGSGTLLTNVLPEEVTYNDDAIASVSPDPAFSNGRLTWEGVVGFDDSVIISFSVTVSPTFGGLIRNTAVISHPMTSGPVTVIAETMVTDDPNFLIGKTSAPAKPGAGQLLTYTLVVSNLGQIADNLAIVVSDVVPADTTFNSVGPDGSYAGGVVTWNRDVTLATGETSIFTFAVDVGDVPSGTIIINDRYQLSSVPTGVTAGAVYTTTVVDPILFISKEIWPDPPGSNREATYTLTVLNKGSLATNIRVREKASSSSVRSR